MIASLACCILEISCADAYGDIGIVASSCLVRLDLEAFTGPNEALFEALKHHKSEASSFLEFLGLAASLRDDGGDVIANLALSVGKTAKRVELAEEMSRQGFVSVAAPQTIAGGLRVPQTAIMGRFGRAALKPICEPIAKEGGTIPAGLIAPHGCS